MPLALPPDAPAVPFDRPVLLVDVDETLFPFAHAYDAWLVKHRGVGLDAAALESYRVRTAAGPDHARLVLEFLGDPRTIAGIAPVAGAADGIACLASRYSIVACTSRSLNEEGELTATWLAQHVPHAEAVVFCRPSRTVPLTAKADIAARWGAVGLVDDDAGHLQGLPARCAGLLIARPAGLPSGDGALDWASVVDHLL